MDWTIDDARQLYNIEGWGVGYFDINEQGNVTVHPTKEGGRGLDLYEIATDLQAQGLGMPILLRFPDILRTRIDTLVSRFATPWRSTSTTEDTPSSTRSR
jgi:arginine decarboxylase